MVKGMTSLAMLSISLPLLWFYWGLSTTLAIAGVLVLVTGFRNLRLVVLIVVLVASLLIRLEREAGSVLPAQWQHMTARMTVCLPQPPKVFDDYQSAVATVAEQPVNLDLRRVRFTASTDFELNAGDCIDADIRLRKPVGRLIPGQFNATRYYFSERIDALGALTGIHAQHPQHHLPHKLFYRASAYFEQPDALAVWTALSLGWSSTLPSHLSAVFEQTQLKHLMVVSGMHVGMVAAWGLLVGRLLLYLPGVPLHQVYRLRLLWVGLLCGAFVALTGFGFPAVRAWVMLMIPLLVLSLGRRFNALDILACAAVAITIMRPQAWLSAGAWLSFGLVAIIVRLAERWYQDDHSALWLALKLQATLTLVMIPVTAAMGFVWHPLSLLINALMIPLVTLLLLPWSLLILLIPDLAWTSGYETVVAFILEQLYSLAPLHRNAPAWTWWQIALIGTGVWWLLSQSIERPVRWLSVPMLFLGLFAFLPSSSTRDGFRLTLLDVGHGQAMALQWPEQTWLYDLGGQWQDGRSQAEERLAPWYRRENIHPDGLLVSHPDIDHAGGASWAARQWPSAQRITGDPIRLQALSGKHGWQDCHAAIADAEALPFTLIAIPLALRTSSNDTSCIISISTPAGRVLITGDASRMIEYWLLQAHPYLFPVTALVVGHHGSQTSSASAFLDASPDALLLVSSGDRHQPRWPNPDLLDYITRHQRQLFNTADLGTFTLIAGRDRMSIVEHRSAYRRTWLK
jgi:competence protein ComEC